MRARVRVEIGVKALVHGRSDLVGQILVRNSGRSDLGLASMHLRAE